MSYVTYARRRSSWERFGWLEPRGQEKTTSHRDYVPRKTAANEIPISVRDLGVSGDLETDIIVIREEGPSEQPDVAEEIWARIGYVILLGLAIFLIGIGFRFIYAGPMPLAVAAIGMGFVAMALWRGGKLEQAL